MSKSALKEHSNRKKHQSAEVKKIKFFFLPVNKLANKISSLVNTHTIVREEVWAFKRVSFGHSFRSNESLDHCFKKMFPDTKIVKNMSIETTKSMYLINHGIADIRS